MAIVPKPPVQTKGKPAPPAAPDKKAAPAAIPDHTIVVGKSGKYEVLDLKFGNRHGLITGATGTGKTVTLQVLAEGFSRAGVPVFAADIKGDLSGVAAPGEALPNFVKRARDLGFDYQPEEFPVVFWDLFGEQGHPIRANVFEMGPLLVARMLELNDVQEGIINIALRFADDDPDLGEADANGVVDLKDFGEPALDIKELMRVDPQSKRGVINVLAADKLLASPRLYATFLLWLLSELFEELPEVGDQPKPKLCFFFDEAHLLFTDAPKALLDKIEQVVRLIRSKGVGVYFVTQNPLDVPDKVLTQLGNRVQHALRAFTPRDQKAVRAAAETFRPNPKLDTAKVIMELGKGEALVSFLEGNGTPSIVERCMVRPPSARLGPITSDERKALMAESPVKGKYDQAIDSESAYEILQKRLQSGAADGPIVAPQGPGGAGQAPQPFGLGAVLSSIGSVLGDIFGTTRPRGRRLSTGQVIAREVTRSVSNRVAGQIAADIGKSIGGKTGSSVGRAIVRGTMGGILRR